MARPIQRAAASTALRLYNQQQSQLGDYYAARAELHAAQLASVQTATDAGFIVPDKPLVKRAAGLDRLTWKMRSQPIGYLCQMFAIAPSTLREWCAGSVPEKGPVRWFWHKRERMACIDDVAMKVALLLANI